MKGLIKILVLYSNNLYCARLQAHYLRTAYYFMHPVRDCFGDFRRNGVKQRTFCFFKQYFCTHNFIYLSQTFPNTLPLTAATETYICNCLSLRSPFAHTSLANKHFSLRQTSQLIRPAVNYSFFTLTARAYVVLRNRRFMDSRLLQSCKRHIASPHCCGVQFHRRYIDVELTHSAAVFSALATFQAPVDVGFRLVLQFWRELQWHCWRKVRAITPPARAVWARKERVDSSKYPFSIATAVCSNRETLPFIRKSF